MRIPAPALVLTLLSLVSSSLGQNLTSESQQEVDSAVLEASEEADISLQIIEDLNSSANVSELAQTENTENTTTTTKLSCSCNNTVEGNRESVVQLVNGTSYQALIYGEHNSSTTNRSQPAICSVTLFYAPWSAPHYNALARVFPQLRFYAIDSYEHHALNTQFGVMALPSILLFHNSRPIFKYNFTDYNLASFSQFINILTGLEPENVTEPEERDYLGPVPTTTVKTTNFYLLAAALFTLLCAIWQLTNSEKVQLAVDGLRNLWREVEMHEHND